MNDPDLGPEARTAALSAAKQELLARLRRPEPITPPVAPAAAPRRPAGSVPLSPPQHGMWLAEKLRPGTALYNLPTAFRLAGPVDAEVLQRALALVFGRHEALRSRIVEEDGQPMQAVDHDARPVLERTDLRDGGRAADPARVTTAVSEFVRRPFDPSRAPLARACLITAADEDHVLAVVVHHLVGDGWSLGIFVAEVQGAYDACRLTAMPTLPPLSLSYADHTQRQLDDGPAGGWASDLEYWKERLAGSDGVLRLPTDRPRPPELSVEGGAQRFTIDERLAAAVTGFARSHGVSVFAPLLAAFQVVMHRFSGQRDIIVGSPTTGRTSADVQALIGLFANVVALRSELDGTETYGHAVRVAARTTREALAHQGVPFERVVEHVQPSRGPGWASLVQVLFVFQNSPLPPFSLGGVQADRVSVSTATSKWDLAVSLEPRDGRIEAEVEYAAALFDDATVRRICDAFTLVLAEGVAAPARPVGDLPLMRRADRERALAAGDGGPCPREDAPVPALVAAHCARQPSAEAIVWQETAITYEALEDLVREFAAGLAGAGITPGSRIGVCVGRSVVVPALVLAIWRAGGIYLPVDPEQPAERIDRILADAAPSVVVADAPAAVRCPATTRLIDLADLAVSPAPAGDAAVPPASAVAYIIYTSGSTGQPKGVEVSHSALAGVLCSLAQRPGVAPGDTMLAAVPLGFDVSIADLLLPLVAGARLAVAPAAVVRDGMLLGEALAEHDVTVFQATPTMWRLLQASGWAGRPSLRAWAGGEALPGDLARWLAARTAQLWNVYGPTEATIWCAVERVQPGDPSATLPIGGRPLPGARFYVLDRNLEPVPAGVPGELYIAGGVLAEGYAARPALSAAAFLPDPFASVPGARMYRTGDFARCRSDGRLDFLGRVDDQIKVRGHRIELGEIEAALAAHPLVESSAVVPVPDETGDLRLAAYVTVDQDRLAARCDAAGRPDVWGDLWDRTYETIADDDPLACFTGWNSSYTGEPIPAAEMTAWADETASRIAALGGQRFLEIGAGTGAILFRLAGRFEAYTAVDASANAVAYLERQRGRLGPDASRARALCASAAELDRDDLWDRVDTVVLNSVVQYFPSPEVLAEVLEICARRLMPGGRVFIGDVRNLDLVNAYHLDVARTQRSGDAPWQVMQRRLASDVELFVSPDFFRLLPGRLRRTASAELFAKALPFDNELSRFRYDAVIAFEPAAAAEPARRLDWVGDALTPERLGALLHSGPPVGLAVENIPDRRTAAAVAAASRATEGRAAEGSGTDEDGGTAPGVPACDATALYAAAAGLSYRIVVEPAPSDRPGTLNAYYHADGGAWWCAPPATTWELAASRPARAAALRELPAELHQHVAARLPAAMCPAWYTVLDELPLTPNRKLNRKLLPPPEWARRGVRHGPPPQTPTERSLAELWQALLGVSQVAASDDFFELGGHSVLANQMTARIRQTLGVHVPLSAVFEAPVLRQLAAAVDAASPHDAAALPPVVHRPDVSSGPLSSAQRRLWFLDILTLGGSAYELDGAFELTGPLDIDAVRAAVASLVARHAALRTIIRDRDGQPDQLVLDDMPGVLTVTNEESGPRGDAGAAPFDLAAGPLIRIRLTRAGQGRHLLRVTIHHVIADAWSLALIAGEISRLYRAEVQGRAPELPAPGLSYLDVAYWQQELLSSGRLDEQLGYWRRQLAGLPAQLSLPTDRPRPAVADGTGGAARFNIPASLLARLQRLASDLHVTPFVVLYAAWAVLLSRYAGTTDVVVGTPDAGRFCTAVEPVIGAFVNNLVLRLAVDERLPFRDLVRRACTVCLEAQANRDVPFEHLVDALRPERDLGRSPLFQVMLILQNVPPTVLDLPGISVTPVPLPRTAAKYDLTLELRPDDDVLHGELEYRADLFEQATAERIAAHLLRLLDTLTAAPDRPAREAGMLSDAELSGLHDAGPPAPGPGQTLDALIQRRAGNAPGRTAVRCGDVTLTYGELDQAIEMLARRLAAAGAGQGVRVAVCLPLSGMVPVGLLAVLRTGATYVPMDPGHPPERLRLIAEDARPRVAICEPGSPAARMLADLPGTALVDPGAAMPDEAGRPGGGWPEPDPGAAAYLMYTSGSTGTPKGVAVSHGSLLNLLAAMRHKPGLREDDRLLSVTTPAFDISMLELLLPLACGAEVQIATDADVADPGRMAGLIEGGRATVMQATPTMWRMLTETSWRPPGHLRILVGGEPVPADLADTLARHAAEVWNVYGPTEATVWATARQVTPGEAAGSGGAVRIGGPAQETHLCVVDRWGRLVPAGVPGELAIGGRGVALGYWQSPRATAERFVPDPFSRSPGGRLYLTGDLVRRTADGTIDFLGRIDHQVKLRGFRIEPGEIEAALRGFDQVSEAVVLLTDSTAGTPGLVAYVVPRPGAAIPSASELRRSVRGRVPEYMVPAAIHVLGELPLTANRKIDRAALRRLHAAAAADTAAPSAPFRSGTEELIRGIWAELLGHEAFSPEDSFFDVGGSSILAVRALTALQKAGYPALTVVDLFAQASPRSLAAYLDGAGTLPARLAEAKHRAARRQAARSRAPRSSAQREASVAAEEGGKR